MSTTFPGGMPLQPGSAAEPVPPSEAALDLAHLEEGACWRERYDISKQLADITYGRCMKALDRQSGRSVVIRSFRVTDASRAVVWTKLCGHPHAEVLGLVEAIEINGRRVEVVAECAGTPLSGKAGTPADEKTLEQVTRNLADLVRELHTCGLVHLNLNPDTVYLDDRSGNLMLGGLHAVADHTTPGLVAVTVDPFYAPPEAVGLFQHKREALLKAWDWWSVGRIVQELTLGKHVLSCVLDRDVSRRTPELMVRAEQVLKEREGQAFRAGAVEVMQTGSERVKGLLRGLLSSCREGRWGFTDVDLWLQGKAPVDRYPLLQTDRLFVWNDRSHTLPEAAALFCQEEHWQEALSQVFTEQTPGTLAHFIAQLPGQRDVRDRLADLSRLSQAAAFAAFDPALVHEVVTGLGLLLLAGAGARLRLRGKCVDQTFLRSLLDRGALPKGFELVQILAEEPVVLHLSNHDSASARLLDDLRRTATAAIRLATEQAWLKRNDADGAVRIWATSLLAPEDLAKLREKARKTYAVSRDPALDALFQAEHPSHAQHVVVAFALQNPRAYQFVTHADWNAERFKHLWEKRLRLARCASLVLLASALRSGPHLIGRWYLFAVYWGLVFGLIAVAFPSRTTLVFALLLLLSAGSLRWFLLGRIRRQVREASFLDEVSIEPLTPTGCLDAARATAGGGDVPQLKQLLQDLDSATAEARTVPGLGETLKTVTPTHFRGIKLLTRVSGIVVLLAILFLGQRVVSSPPSWEKLELAWLHPEKIVRETPPTRAPAGSAEEEPANLARVAWSFRMPDVVNRPRVLRQGEATPEQARAAEALGGRVCASYRPETIDSLITVRVPAEKGVALMLYDGRGAKLAERHVYELGYVPMARSWVQLGDRVAIYLD